MRAVVAVAFVALIAVGTVFLRAESQEAPDAVVADPDHYSVEFENDSVRVLRIRYGPGETSVMHRHPANCTINVTDSRVTFELPDGETVDASSTAGTVLCGDAAVHLPTNTGDEALDVIAVELKGRDTFAQ